MAVKSAIIRKNLDKGNILILAGKGNNGGDGYALACSLAESNTTVCDVFSAGQRTTEGNYWLNKLKDSSASLISGICPELFEKIKNADCIVDAIFGTGFKGEIPKELEPLVSEVNSSSAYKIAIDLPLGANAEDGSLCRLYISADLTVTLSYPKVGLLSYPARGVLGELEYSDIGLPKEIVEKEFSFNAYSLDNETARSILPKRDLNSNKGTFGKVTLIVGSEKYKGAAHLAAEAALRSGAGIVKLVANEALCFEIRQKFPEIIYYPAEISETEKILDICKDSSSILVGCGCESTKELFLLLSSLLENSNAKLVFDADALNSIAAFYSPEILKKAKRKVLITPHPLELSRLSGVPVSKIESARLSFAKSFAESYECLLLLKGAATILTDGKTVYINECRTSSLSKGGSGDALGGAVASLLAFSESALEAAALAAFVHGRAGERLSAELSSFGVTPSDLPREMAKVIASLEKNEI